MEKIRRFDPGQSGKYLMKRYTSFEFVNGNLVRRDFSGFEFPGGQLPFDSRALLACLDEE